MNESQFQAKLVKDLNNHGWFYKSSDRFRAGIPDVLGCYKGVFMGLELKVDSNPPTKLQVWELERITAEGGYAAVVTYNNKTKTHNIGSLKLKTREELVECILKQSLLHTRGSA